ncbi:catenin alpha [Sarotherodon galilaeus]
MSHETSNNSLSDRGFREESHRLYGLVEREIPDPMQLQDKIKELQLELSTLKLKKNYYQNNYYRLKDECEHRCKDVQEESLLEQNSSIAAQLPQIESERNEQKKENANLKKALESLEYQVGEAHHKTTKKDEIIDKQNREILHKIELIVELKKEICVLQRRVRHDLDEKQLQVESLEAKIQEQVQTIQMMHNDFVEKDESLLEQNSSIPAQLSQIESERNEQKKEIANLKKTLESLECQVGEARHKTTEKDEIIEKQNREIVQNQELIVALKKETCVLQRKVRQALDEKKSQVESVEAKFQEQVQTIQTMQHDFQEMEESLLEQNSSSAAQLSQIESERNEQKKEIANLKKTLESLECQVGEAHHKTTKKDEIIDKQNREILHKIELMVELKKEICVLQRKVRQALDEKKSQVESLEAKIQEQVQTIQTMQYDFVEKEESLLEQNSSIHAQLSQIESERNEQKKENANLKKTLESLECQVREGHIERTKKDEMIENQIREILHNQERIVELEEHIESMKQVGADLKNQLNEHLLAENYALKQNEEILTKNNETLSAELALLQTITEKKREELKNLTQQIFRLEYEVKDIENVKQAQLESVKARSQAEIKTIQMSLHELQQKEEFLLEQNSSIDAERNELKKENTILRKGLENLEYQVRRTTESRTQQIFILEEIIKNQNSRIVHMQDLIDELYEHLKVKRKINENLKVQLRREEEGKILAAALNFEDSCQITDEPLQLENLAPEPEDLDSLVSEPSPDVVLTQENLAPEPEDLDSLVSEPSPDVVLTQENFAPEPEELDSPVSEPPPDVVPTSSSWRHGAKRLLKVGLGLAAAGIVVSAAYWGFSMSNSCSPYDSVYGLLESYCYLGGGSVPF